MASMILVAMVTFVFCSGFGSSRDEGGLGGLISRLFRSRGEVYAEIDNSNYYSEEFREMKMDRDIANKFMIHVIRLAKARAEEYLKLPEELKKQFGDRDIDKEDVGILLKTYNMLDEKLKTPRFFEGGQKLADLVERKIWLLEADRLGILIADKPFPEMGLEELILSEVTLRLKPRDKSKRSQTLLVYPADLGKMSILTRRDVARDVGQDRVTRALNDEFRVQIAKLALLQAPNLFGLVDREKEVLTRATPSPDELWQYFKKYRNTYDVQLAAVSASELAKTVKDPDEATLAKFFRDNKDKVEDPASDQTGLKPPRERFMVHFLMGDSNAKAFKSIANAVHALQHDAHVVWNPLLPPLLSNWHLLAGDEVLKGEIDTMLNEKFGAGHHVIDLYSAGERGSPDYELYLLGWLARDNPTAKAEVANLVASALGDGLPLFSAAPLFAQEARKKHEDFLKQALAAEDEKLKELTEKVHKEIPAITAVVASAQQPFLAGAFATGVKGVEAEDRFLPFSLYRDIEEPKLINAIAPPFVQAAMVKARADLKGASGIPGVLKTNLAVIPSSLTLVSSTRPYTLYEMEKAPELEPLKKAFEKSALVVDQAEGRTKDKLSDKSFAQALFFTPTERHSTLGRSYSPTAWPPKIEIQQPPEFAKLLVDRLEGRPVNEQRYAEAVARMKHADPRENKTEVDLFKNSETPILFWREDPPKTDTALRWVDDIQADLKRKVAAVESQLEKDIALAKAVAKPGEEEKLKKIIANKTAEAKDREADLKAKADQDSKSVRARTLEAYKLEQARDKLAPDLAKKLALGLAAKGGLGYIPADLQEIEKTTGQETVRLYGIAPWYQPMPRGPYEEFSVAKRKDLVFPRADMGQKILSLPTLDKAFEFKNDAVDAINKELFAECVKAFEKLGGDKDKESKPRIVQLIPNQPRTMYYIAVLTSPRNPPEPSRMAFNEAVSSLEQVFRIGNEVMRIPGTGDPFLNRVYEQIAKEWRDQVVDGLKRQHSASIKASADTLKSSTPKAAAADNNADSRTQIAGRSMAP
ncbi:MAG: hypothetical protein U0793_25630 [Gemmataceae bacterium]